MISAEALLRLEPATHMAISAVLKGTQVKYYPNGNRNSDWKVAWATNDTTGGSTDLIILGPNTNDRKRNVRHIDDDFLKTRANVRRRDGAWDFFNPQASEDVQRILEWAGDYEFETVCKKARPRGITEDQVRKVFEQHRLPIPEEVTVNE